MVPDTDHALGQQLTLLIQQSGESAFEAGVLSRRLQAQLQDLLGADTTLLIPLRDLFQRPAFRQLFTLGSQGQALNARDALLGDLAQVYSPAILSRLDAVLRGCLNLSANASTTWRHSTPWGSTAQSAGTWYGYAPSETAAAPQSPQQPQPTVVTIPASQQGPTTIVIALLALICGALVMALAGVLITNRNVIGTNTAPATQSRPNPEARPPVAPEPSPRAPEAAPTPEAAVQWQACVTYSGNEGPAPQAGETWWPVVGQRDALEDARKYCRGDAFINKSGNAQIASFRDRDTANIFAQQLSADSTHPHRFWVGDPTER